MSRRLRSDKAMFEKGLVPSFDGDAATEVRRWYAKAAEAGERRAQFALAGIVQAEDQDKALNLMHDSAQRGHSGAMFYMFQKFNADADALRAAGLSSKQQTGMARRVDDLAMEWLRRAATSGHPGALNELGERLRDGRGMKRDLPAAFNAFASSAAKDANKAAIKNMARCQRDGVGTVKSADNAIITLRRLDQEEEPSPGPYVPLRQSSIDPRRSIRRSMSTPRN